MRIRTLTLKVDREDLLALSMVMQDALMSYRGDDPDELRRRRYNYNAVVNLLPLMKEE